MAPLPTGTSTGATTATTSSCWTARPTTARLAIITSPSCPPSTPCRSSKFRPTPSMRNTEKRPAESSTYRSKAAPTASMEQPMNSLAASPGTRIVFRTMRVARTSAAACRPTRFACKTPPATTWINTAAPSAARLFSRSFITGVTKVSSSQPMKGIARARPLR